MALNPIQQEILDGILNFVFEACSELKPEEAMMVLEAIVKPSAYAENLSTITTLDMLETVQQVQRILNHPSPQNRMVGDKSAASGAEDGVIDGEAYYWTEGFGSTVKHEPVGLLGLTGRDSAASESVTKKDVVNYVKHKVYSRIYEYLRRLKLTPWDYFIDSVTSFFSSPPLTVMLTHNDITLVIKVLLAMSKKEDPGYMVGVSEATLLNIIVKNADKVRAINHRLIEEGVSIRKRVTRGDGFDDFPIKIGGSGLFSLGFRGKDPAASELIDIASKYIFDEPIPMCLLNRLREAIGQELLEYKEDVQADVAAGAGAEVVDSDYTKSMKMKP